MKTRLMCMAILLALAGGARGAEDELKLEPGFTRLDTGKDLQGWIVRPGFEQCFTVKDGNIRVADIAGGPRGGRLESTAPHGRNVVIRLQYRATHGADSGVFLWGRQFQVRDYENSLPDTKRLAAYDKPAGQWNDLEFDVADGKATIRLNGQVIAKDWRIGEEPKRGLGLQKEVGDFDFRFIRMRQSGLAPPADVAINDAFWAPRIDTNRRVTVWYDFQKCEETGRIANFARAGGLEQGGFQGIPFNDSDVAKVVEGASYALALRPDPKLDQYLDTLIAKIAAAQEDDGYLYTARTLGVNDDFTGPARWSNLRRNHELYNVGHMYEAAVAHYQATGKRTLLDVAIRNADLVCKTFGPGDGQLVDVPGHEEIEIGLVKLHHTTGDDKYLRQAKFFIDMRGRADRRKIWGEYCQDHKPVVEQEEAVGHAVRGGYLYAGVADVAAITGNQDYIAAIDRIWNDVISRKLYLTGNVGQFGHGEGYEGAYRLPNLKAYNETCAAIALALWTHRMFLLHGDAQHIDVLERILYNGFLAGVSLSGDRFFYPNPLACDMKFQFNHGSLERSPWFNCSCCPVNVVRFIPSVAGYIYACRGDSAYVNLFIASRGKVKLSSGAVVLTQHTRYPWDGSVKLTVEPAQAAEFALHLRIPGWAVGRPLPSDLYRYMPTAERQYTIKVNGAEVQLPVEKGFAVLRRKWERGDVVELDLPMPARRVLAHRKVEADRGRAAVERGPIVYCIEGADHHGKVLDIWLPDDAALTAAHQPDLLGGVTVLNGAAQRVRRRDDGSIATEPVELKMIPYFAWCHRGPNEMTVWIPRTTDVALAPLQ